MRVALITPIATPSVRGNAVTVERLARGLRDRGVLGEVVDLSLFEAAAVEVRLDGFEPEIVHAFHAFRAGPVAAAFAGSRGLPLVVSLTGTDINHDVLDPSRRAATLRAIETARAVVVFHETIRRRVAREVPAAGSRTEIIPQSVTLGDEPFPLAQLVPRRPGEVVFLLPAGIRRVKNALFPIPPLRRLAERHALRFLVAGPVIEESEGARLAAALKDLDWATSLGEVPHAQMRSLLEQVDVVINSSLSEGGMANSVLEAMSCGKPVLASDIEGNRSLIEDEIDGLLYGSSEAFERQAERLVRDAALRRRLGGAARDKVTRLYPLGREIDAYLRLYRRLVTV